MSFPTSWMKTQALSTNVSHYFYSNVRVQLIFNVPIFTSKYHWTGNKTVFRDSQPTKNQNDQCWFYLASLSVGFGDAISRGKSKSCDQFMAVRIRMNTHDRIILTVDNWNGKEADPYLRLLLWMLPVINVIRLRAEPLVYHVGWSISGRISRRRSIGEHFTTNFKGYILQPCVSPFTISCQPKHWHKALNKPDLSKRDLRSSHLMALKSGSYFHREVGGI